MSWSLASCVTRILNFPHLTYWYTSRNKHTFSYIDTKQMLGKYLLFDTFHSLSHTCWSAFLLMTLQGKIIIICQVKILSSVIHVFIIIFSFFCFLIGLSILLSCYYDWDHYKLYQRISKTKDFLLIYQRHKWNDATSCEKNCNKASYMGSLLLDISKLLFVCLTMEFIVGLVCCIFACWFCTLLVSSSISWYM